MADSAGTFLVELNMTLEESSARTCMFAPLSETDYCSLRELALSLAVRHEIQEVEFDPVAATVQQIGSRCVCVFWAM